jgi:hypothetical protein
MVYYFFGAWQVGLHLAGGASLFLASPRKSNQKEGDPGPQVSAERADYPSLRTNLRGRSDVASCAGGPKPAIPGRFTP